MAFVVDTSKLKDMDDITADDIMADDIGVWKNNCVDTGYVQVSVEEEAVQVGPPAFQSAPTYTLKQVYHIHGTNHTLKKLMACLYGKFTHCKDFEFYI